MGAPLFSYGMPLKITDIQISHTLSPSQITIKLSKPSHPRIFVLTHPDRLVLDFTRTQLAIKLHSLDLTNTDIKNVRIGQPHKDIFRLVFDINYFFHFKIMNKLPADQIVVTLSTSREKTGVVKFVAKKQLLNPQKSMLVGENHSFVVMIDPGHGGKDTGAIGDRGTKEKEVVFKIAEQLAALINQEPGMHAVLTRYGDYYVTLHNRLVYARKNKADIYISIHADSYFNNRASGASVYALSKHGATSIAARWLARRDNYSELEGVALAELNDQSSLLRSVLIDLAQTATVRDSMRLGTSILDALDNVTMLHYSRLEQAPFMVLKSPDIPSILVETGFISNLTEESRLRDKAYQHKIAAALFNGIRYYQKKYAGASV